MSTSSNPQVDAQILEQTRRQINRLLEEVRRLAESDISPSDFHAETLKRTLAAMAAPAGAMWTLSPQGNLALQFQINLQQLGFDKNEAAKLSHDQLLRQAMQNPQPMYRLPQSGDGPAPQGEPGAANLTSLLWLLVPVTVGNQIIGLIEVWQNPQRPRNAIPGFLQFMSSMAEQVGRYSRNHQVKQLSGQQEVWTQLEAFTRQVHNSLKPVEVAYQVANEGRRLIDCDRLSVGVREGSKARVEAVSGSDVVEKRSNLVVQMRNLFNAVLEWNEQLVYTGEKDESLPPKVVASLDKYLAESNSKFLVCQPLHDERDAETKKRARSALLMECFEPNENVPQLLGKLDVVGKHACSALYNSVQYRRIPMKWVWMPLAKVQEGMGGKARMIWTIVLLLLVAFFSVMFLVQWPLKMEASGKLQPATRVSIYAPREGRIVKVYPKSGQKLKIDDRLAMLNVPSLGTEILELQQTKSDADSQLSKLRLAVSTRKADADTLSRISKLELDKKLAELRLKAIDSELHRIDSAPGMFEIRAPDFKSIDLLRRRGGKRIATNDANQGRQWTVLTSDLHQLLDLKVDRTMPLMELGDVDGEWQVELKIKQQHIGQVKKAFEYVREQTGDPKRNWLEVDLLIRSDPTRTFKGVLYEEDLGGQATPDRNENDEPEPVVSAIIILNDRHVPAAKQVPRELYVAGTEVTAKINCGNHDMGYSLFYGVWEFFYEKVLFRF